MDVRIYAGNICMGILMLLVGRAFVACADTKIAPPEPQEVEMHVWLVGVENTTHWPTVVLADAEEKRILPVFTGAAEAATITGLVKGIVPNRPTVYDLIKTMLDGAGVTLQKVIIDRLVDNTYCASISLHSATGDWQVDSGASDGIALALRFGQPIFAASMLLKSRNIVEINPGQTKNSI